MNDFLNFDLESFRARPLPLEHEIMSKWNDIDGPPVLSVICVTYNHEEYLEDALRGFLFQATNFKFEVVVYDDASKDRTSEIVRYYAQKYPSIIRPLIQTVNQYSQGKRPTQIAYNATQGSYIALCEGDDIWIDRTKLQVQYEALRDNSISVVFHSAIELNVDSGERKIIARHSLVDGFVPLKKSVKGRGGFMPTASLCFRSELMKENLVFFNNDLPLGDFFLQNILSYSGRVYYSAKPMSLYRRNSVGSWTERHKNKESAKKYYSDMVEGIFLLYEYLRPHPKSYLLVYPLFFYAQSSILTLGDPVRSLWRLATLKGISSFTLRGKCLYYAMIFLLPIKVLKKQFGFLGGAGK